MKTQREYGHLQVNKRDLKRSQPCWHLDSGSVASKIVGKEISVVWAIQHVVLCYSSPSQLIQACLHLALWSCCKVFDFLMTSFLLTCRWLDDFEIYDKDINLTYIIKYCMKTFTDIRKKRSMAALKNDRQQLKLGIRLSQCFKYILEIEPILLWRCSEETNLLSLVQWQMPFSILKYTFITS